MASVARNHTVQLWVLAACFGVVVLLSGSRDVFWTGDFFNEVYSPYLAVILGREDLFFDLLPAYSGFATVVGFPASLLTGLLDGRETMVFRLTAAPGLLALGAVGVMVAGAARAAGRTGWPLFLIAAMGGALTYQTLLYGHPEDLTACGLMVLGVLLARKGRLRWAAVCLVLAVVAKQWAVLAILPAALAAPRGGVRLAALAFAGAAVAVVGQMALVADPKSAVAYTGALFHPHALWWPFGVDATAEFTAAGHGERMAPEWLSYATRPVLMAVGLGTPLAWWLLRGERRERDDALLLLALVFLLRCLFDPWNLIYYHLPIVVALAAWEGARGRELPVLSVAVTALCWCSFIIYDARTGNGPFLAYLAWTLPLAGGMVLALFKPGLLRRPGPAAVPAPA